MRPGGKLSFSGMAFLAAFVFGAWWLFNFAGLYLDNFDAKEALGVAYNQAGKLDDKGLKGLVVSRINTLGTHREDDGEGHLVEKPGVSANEDDVTVERDELHKTIRISLVYAREVKLRPQGGYKKVPFHVSYQGPIPP